MNDVDDKRDPETGDWISDLKPGATDEAKSDKAVADTFPASDPPNLTGAVTGFITPEGEDLGEKAAEGDGKAGTPSGGKP